MKKSYVCIGHVCHDKTPVGFVPGGTVTFASVLAVVHGFDTSIWTSKGNDFLFDALFTKQGIQLYTIPAKETTTFENIYLPEGRSQFLLARAAELEYNYFPHALANCNIIHLGAIANEIDYKVLSCLHSGLIGASIQGSLRHWDHRGRIFHEDMDWKILNGIDILILSMEDIEGRESVIGDILPHVGHIVLTKGSNGATVYFKSEIHHHPAFPVQEVDATGAGDVFAAAYLIAYSTSQNIAEAAMMAHCTASFIVEGAALSFMPTLEMIRSRTIKYMELFCK